MKSWLEIKRPIFASWNMARGPKTELYRMLQVGKKTKKEESKEKGKVQLKKQVD